MSIQDISAVIITRDAAQTLPETLASLAGFGEVVVYDNGSTDGTQDICRQHANVRLHEGPFLGFGPTKNHAATLAGSDWVLSIDADEVVSPGLCASLDSADLGDPDAVYQMDRHNFFMGRRVRHAGWNDDWLVRLYRRDHHGFNDAMVHEKFARGPGGRTVRLAGPLEHNAVQELSQVLVKVNRYSELRRQMSGRRRGPFVIVLQAGWAFFSIFVLRGGFLDGWRGLVIAWTTANGVFFKYMKPYVDRIRRSSEH